MTIRYQYRNQPFHSFHSADNTYPLHLHKNVELVAVLSGQIQLTTSQQEYLLSEGDVAVIFPNEPHGYRTKEQSLILLVLFDPSYAGDYGADLVNYVPDHPVLHREQVSSRVMQTLHTLHHLYAVREDNRLIKAYTTVLMGHLLPLLNLKRTDTNKDPDMVQKLLGYLDTHYLEPITLDTLAKELGTNKFTISRIFSEQLRTSFRDYLNGRRAALAQSLLQSTTSSVTDIAFDCGFNSLRSFYRAFKKAYGVSPNELRRNGEGNVITSSR